MEQNKEYYAFISYKHEQKSNGKFATDEKWAHIFKKNLESWKIPTHIPIEDRLNKNDKMIFPVFRDSENYPSSQSLNQLTYKFLAKSKTLVVILSREMLEDQFKLRYEDGDNAWIFNEIERFIDLGNSKDSIIAFYVGEDDINPNELIKNMIDRCEAKEMECKALQYIYQPERIVKRLRDFKDKGKDINQYATAIIAAGIFNSDPLYFINAYELAERKREVLSECRFSTDDGYTYDIIDEESVFLQSVPFVRNVVVPSVVEYKGFEFNVTGIGEGPFYSTELLSIFIPKTILYILCDTLFAHQDVIESVIIEDGNPKYDSRNNCNAIIETATNTLLFGCKSTIIPYGITEVANRAFCGCKTLLSIVLPNSVQSIGECSFKDCEKMSEAVMSSNISRIGASAFSGCKSLKDITIFPGLKSIENDTFSGCSSLVSINLPEGITQIGSRAFYNCLLLSNIDLPTTLNHIEDFTFSGCESIQSIHLSDQIVTIGKGAFSGCSSLTGIKIPPKVIVVDSHTFRYCSSINSIELPYGIKAINDNAFEDCSSLQSVNIPETLSIIGQLAFHNCFSLNYINIPQSVELIGYETFKNCYSLKEIELPNVKSIGVRAFGECTSLRYIKFSDSLRDIARWAFEGCVSLVSINIPNGLTSIVDDVFCDCCSLTSILIPESLVNIASRAFPAGKDLDTIKVDVKNKKYDSRGDCNAIIETEGNRLILACKNTIIPNSVSIIGPMAFYNCSSPEVILPNSITTIEASAFSNHSSLISIKIPDGVTTINEAAFGNCESLESISIPASVINIGFNTFSDCYSLSDIYYNGTIEQWKIIQKGWWWQAEIPGVIVHCKNGDIEI